MGLLVPSRRMEQEALREQLGYIFPDLGLPAWHRRAEQIKGEIGRDTVTTSRSQWHRCSLEIETEPLARAVGVKRKSRSRGRIHQAAAGMSAGAQRGCLFVLVGPLSAGGGEESALVLSGR